MMRGINTMEIGYDKKGYWELDAEAMRALILGKVTWKRCYSCDKGLVWVDGFEGVECSAMFVEEMQDDVRFYQDMCEDCMGVGFIYLGVEE